MAKLARFTREKAFESRGRLMLAGVLFSLAPPALAQVLPLTPTYQFSPPVSVGAAPEAGMVTVRISGSGSLSAINVLTQGVPNLDFTLAAGGGCAVGTGYFPGQTCTVALNFLPRYPGLRQGAIVLLANDGSILGSELIDGTGLGSVMTFMPGFIQAFAGNGPRLLRLY